jgi:hypothetical protein
MLMSAGGSRRKEIMAKNRRFKQPSKTNVPRQGSRGRVFTQSPMNQGGAPSKKEAPSNRAMMKNRSMKSPGSGTRGSGKGAH